MRLKTALLASLCLGLASGRASATTLIDLSTAGASSGTKTSDNGVQFIVQQIDPQSTGTGVIDSFLRIQQTGQERGYNTSLGAPLDDKAGNFTHALTLGAIPIVNVGGVDYRQFLLDINQNGTELLSLNQIQIFQTNQDMLHTGLTEATASNEANIAFAGATQVFRMSDVASLQAADAYEIKMDYALNSGSGSGDMFLYVKNSAFTQNNATNIILFSQFGAPPGQWESNDGFEEWAVLEGGGSGSGGQSAVPEPASLLLLGTGLAFAARRARRRKN